MRKPLALSNWKMAMTLAQSATFVRSFLPRAAELANQVDIVICPPYTALAAVTTALEGSPITTGGQDLWPGPGEAHTGAISAALLKDAGATWVLVGHWEIRRRLGEDDRAVNQRILAAQEYDLRPILLVGENLGATFDPARFTELLQGLRSETVARMAFVYEPEGAIGAAQPAIPQHAAMGCRTIRGWLASRYGEHAAVEARIIYGGSVTPQHAPTLLADPDVDGLGASRRGRDPESFAQIVRHIAKAKNPGSS